MGEVTSYTKEGIDAAIAAAVAGGVSQEDIDAAIAALVDSAPGTLDTLNELSAALQDDPDIISALQAQIAAAGGSSVLDIVQGGDPASIPTFVGITTSQNETLTVPAGTIAGDLILIAGVSGSSTLSGLTDDGFAQIGWQDVASTGLQLWAKFAGGAEPATYAVELAPANYGAFTVSSWRNAGLPVLWAAAEGNGHTTPAITAQDLSVVVRVPIDVPGSWTETAGWTKRAELDGGSGLSVAFFDKAFTGSEVVPANEGYTGSKGNQSGVQTFVIPTIGSGTMHTLELTDAGKVVEMGPTAEGTVIVPNNTDVAFPVGTVLWLRRTNSADVNITAGSGVTLQPGEVTLDEQFSQAKLHKRADNTWSVTLIPADVATQAELDAIVASLSVIGQVTPTDNYTLILTDAGKSVEMDKATAVNLTIPLNATVAFPIGTVIEIWQKGAGQVTVVATGGVTIRSTEGKLKSYGQYSSMSLRKRGTDEWVLVGDLVA